MFENVLGQAAAAQLIKDIKGAALAPAMLFSGPAASGKGTAALELGRVISCEEKTNNTIAAWNCGCSACARHRLLVHPDLLCLGPRPFSAEIAASAGTFKRDISASQETKGPQSRVLFIRSVRKLLSRFNPVLWEDDPKAAKMFLLVNSIEEDLDELDFLARQGFAEQSSVEQSSVLKLTEGIIKNAIKLESEGMSENIPIAQIRRAAWWCRLAPSGKGKLLVIENADRMLEEARNAMLKLLEEPPGRVTIVLCTPRPGSLLRTMVSRLRPYRFSSRDAAVEEEVVRRVFKDQIHPSGRLADYLDSFLPVSGETLEALAAFFASNLAYKAVKTKRTVAEEVVLLGKYCTPKAQAAGYGRPNGDSAALIAFILEKAEKFEIRSLFSRFLSCLLEQAASSQKPPSSVPSPLPNPAYNELWKKHSLWAETAVQVYKLRPGQVLEKIFTDLSRGMAEL